MLNKTTFSLSLCLHIHRNTNIRNEMKTTVCKALSTQMKKSAHKKPLGPLHVCGGTVIGPDVILTAAECLFDHPPVPVLPWIAPNRLVGASKLKVSRQLQGTASG